MSSSSAHDVLQILREIDETVADSAARIEHCRALIRDADKLLARMRGEGVAGPRPAESCSISAKG